MDRADLTFLNLDTNVASPRFGIAQFDRTGSGLRSPILAPRVSPTAPPEGETTPPAAMAAADPSRGTAWSPFDPPGHPEGPLPVLAPSFSLPRARIAHTVPVHQWVGVVSEATEDDFTADLEALSGDEPSVRVTFELNELSAGDVELLEPGAVIYWTLARVSSPAGIPSTSSFVRIRRLPAITERDLVESEKATEGLAQALGIPRDAPEG